MGKYSDDEIRAMKKITCKIAADYLGIAPMAVSIGMQQNRLPILHRVFCKRHIGQIEEAHLEDGVTISGEPLFKLLFSNLAWYRSVVHGGHLLSPI